MNYSCTQIVYPCVVDVTMLPQSIHDTLSLRMSVARILKVVKCALNGIDRQKSRSSELSVSLFILLRLSLRFILCLGFP